MKTSQAGIVLILALASCSQNHKSLWLGYAEGDNTYIAAPHSGWITKVNVQRGTLVTKGEKLFELDDTSQAAMRDEAKAQLLQAKEQVVKAKANLDLARKELTRQENMLRANDISKQSYDIAKTNYETAKAKLGQMQASENRARAALANAAYQLSQRKIVSLTAGRVQDVFFRTGEYAPAMTPVVSVLPPKSIFVRFFVPEDQLSKIRLGQKVKIHCDGCSDNIMATISFIASREEFTPPVIFSNQSRKQLVFKVEARAPSGLKLNPGQPVDIRPL